MKGENFEKLLEQYSAPLTRGSISPTLIWVRLASPELHTGPRPGGLPLGGSAHESRLVTVCWPRELAELMWSPSTSRADFLDGISMVIRMAYMNAPLSRDSDFAMKTASRESSTGPKLSPVRGEPKMARRPEVR